MFLVWSENVGRIHRVSAELEVGTVWNNCWLIRDLNMPFGGCKQSGIGREGIIYSLETFTNEKTVCIKIKWNIINKSCTYKSSILYNKELIVLVIYQLLIITLHNIWHICIVFNSFLSLYIHICFWIIKTLHVNVKLSPYFVW